MIDYKPLPPLTVPNEEANALVAAFDETGVTFHSRAESLAAFKKGREIVFEDGKPFANTTPKSCPLVNVCSGMHTTIAMT